MANWPFVQRCGSKWRGWYIAAGKRRYLPLRDSAKEASQEAQSIRSASHGGRVGMSLGALADRFLAETRNLRTFATWQFYSQQLDGVFRHIGRDTLVALLTAADMRHLIVRMQAGKFAAQTIQHRRATLRRMFRWGIRAGLCDRDLTADVDWPQARTAPVDVLTSAELGDMLEQLRAVPADYDLVLVAVFTGLRKSELARLKIQDIDLSSGILWVDGKRRRESVPLDDCLRPSLIAMIDRTGGPWLLPESNAHRGQGKKATAGLTPEEIAEKRRAATVGNLFRRWAKKLADRRFHPHTLRHSLCTELLRSGAELKTAGDMLRHKQVQTTARYAHLVAADLRKALGRLRIVRPEAGESRHG